jgi:hypothetical protein
MPACLEVSPNLKRETGAPEEGSDNVGRDSAASLIAPVCRTNSYSNAYRYDIATSFAAPADSTESLAFRDPSIHCSYQRVTFSKLHKKKA